MSHATSATARRSGPPSGCRAATILVTVVSRVTILALVVAGLTVLGPDQALANQVSCGTTITTDTKLDSDLVDCPSNGILMGADNITLDLNGHTIDGDAQLVAVCPEGEDCDLGVDNTAGHHGITIMGGSVRDFATGIFVLGANDNRLQRLNVSGNIFSGVLIGESARTRVEESSISRNGLPPIRRGWSFSPRMTA